MTSKCYQDFEGNIICSDDYIFPENSEDDYYINEWYRNVEEIYIEILKENTRYYNDYIRGKF